ncbi:GlsB/YeaQ/YmgE family stress response membrane protein [Novipirellula sp. SH528]|uniref:GlsB/YeaQ/YmgE family stress response membrane protein n=1 Tax=Novipirellula sp. SH528 TaxID=3454466 RepID=UPI003FA04139
MLIPIIGWMISGLIIGLIARALVPGRQAIGLMRTMLLGIVGSFIGGFAGFLIMGGEPLQASGWIGSIVGAVVLLVLFSRRDRVTA